MFSEGIRFSQENPDIGEPITIFAYIYYSGSEPVYNVPVAINDILPVGGVLKTFKIGSSLVSFSNPEDGSPAVVSLPWTNNAEGAHIIQVVTEPPFPQFTGNDKATRLIYVGEPVLVEIDKDVTLGVDADGNGVISPGDTVRYTISYRNIGTGDATSGVIIDDFDETLLEGPSNISDGGVVSDGSITWNLDPIAAGASGSVTYEVNIKPLAELPTGTTVVANIALLTTDQTPTVAATLEVPLNVPPNVEAGPDQAKNEGDTVSLAPATFSDANVYDTHTASIDWGDGSPVEVGTVSESGGSGTVSGSHVYADNGIYTLQVCITDGLATACDTLTVTVDNVQPSVDTPTVSPEPSDEGSSVTVSATFSDLGVNDAPFTCTVNYGDGTDDLPGTINDSTCLGPSHTYADNGSYVVTVAVMDKDGETGTDPTTHVVNNVAPTVGAIYAPVDPVQIGSEISASAVFTDPGVLDSHTIKIARLIRDQARYLDDQMSVD